MSKTLTPQSLDLTAIARRAIAVLDLTSLNEDCDAAAIEALCLKAMTPHGPAAAVCIFPRFVTQAKRLLKGTGIKVATVANFPAGENDPGGAVATTVKAFADGADEVDVVLPYGTFLEGKTAAALKLLRDVRAEVPRGKKLKVIIETGELKSEMAILAATQLAIEAGAHFVKTSTGKTPESATPRSAFLILETIRASKKKVGFKAAGGIRTTVDAGIYLAIADGLMGRDWATPATFRFGASGVLDDLMRVLSGEAAPTPAKDRY